MDEKKRIFSGIQPSSHFLSCALMVMSMLSLLSAALSV